MDNLNKSGQNVLQMQETNLITLLKNPQKFKETFSQMQKLASESLKIQQYQKALKALNKCADMLDLGKNILKEISKYSKLCIHANIACAYQGTWKMQKCNKFCEKAEEQLQKLLQSADSKQNYLNLSKTLIRIRFQHCAILSQLNQHQKALQLCKSTLTCLSQYIQSILEYAQSLNHNAGDCNKSSETVQFSRHVGRFAAEILNNLLNKMKEPLTSVQDKSSFYYWQRNPENNEDQVKKRFVTGKSSDECKRSILGVNKMNHWIDQFNIGTIMHMSELSVKDFENNLPIQQYIFKDKLYETVIYCSVAHFTIATEMRFIQSNKDKDKLDSGQRADENAGSSNVNLIMKKYGFKQKSQMFMMSELYHLRAIHIIAENIKTTVPYISHLIKSYDKHYIYKKQLEPVVAIDEQSLLSNNQLNCFKQKEQKNQQENQIIENQNIYYAGQQIVKEQKQVKAVNIMTEPITSLNDRQTLQSHDQMQEKLVQFLQPVIIKQQKYKKRNKSEGRLKKIHRDKTKSKFEKNEFEQKKNQKQKGGKQKKGKNMKQKQKQLKQGKRKKNEEIEGEVRINHQSCTQIKVVMFKKKK